MRAMTLFASILLISCFALAQDVDVPLHNWTAPPFTQFSSGGIHAMTDVTGPRAFIPIQPCRVADTRGNGAPIQGGIFTNSEARDWLISGKCGIPSGADAISVNFTVVSAPATPQGGFLLAWPTGSPPPPGVVTAIVTYGPGVTVISNAAIVPLNGSGLLTINVSHSTHIVMDVNGYFGDTINNPTNGFRLQSSLDTTATFTHSSQSCNATCAVFASSNTLGSGRAISGIVGGGGDNSAGVFGRHGAPFFVTSYTGAGVRGESHSLGVLGVTNSEVAFGVGTSGSLLNPLATAALAEGYLGYYTGASYGVYSVGNAHVQGTFTAAVNKAFVQPHPHDASKEIQYISLEGPHSEVYFRGTAQISRGVTRIPIPEHFRFVADGSTYSTLVTPVGRMATVAVLLEGPGGITVEASRDVKIHYVVYAEREAARHPDPVVENIHFRPATNNDFRAHLPESFIRLLIQNGTLNPDRTVNQDTARRLGWDKLREERSQPAPQPAP